MSRVIDQSTGELTPRYQPLRRPCDDPRENFLKIRDENLWWIHELKLEAKETADYLESGYGLPTKNP